MFKKSSVEKTTYTWDPEQEIDNFIGFVRSGDEHFLDLCKKLCVEGTYNAIIGFNNLQHDQVAVYFNYYIIPNKETLKDPMGRDCTNLNLNPTVLEPLINDYQLYLKGDMAYLVLMQSLWAALRHIVGEIVSGPLYDIMGEYRLHLEAHGEQSDKRCVIS